MIFGEGRVTKPTSLEEGSSSFGDALTASFQEALSDNVGTKILEWNDKRNLRQNAIDQGKKFIPKDEAQSIAQKQGVNVNNLPDSIDEDSLNFLIERQYKKKVRNEVMASADSGFANITGGLAGSLIDPLNIATAFIPVVGQAKMAAIAARATLGARLAGRAAVGAIEGAVGATLLEPASYLLSQELGDDYTVANSFANIAFGTALGVGLHTAVGAGIEIKNKAFPELTPVQKLSKQFDNMNVEQRQSYIKSAIAQMQEDRPINIDLIDTAHKAEVKAKMDDLDLKIKQARTLGDEDSVAIFTEKYEALNTQLDGAAYNNQTVDNVEAVAAAEPKKLDGNYIERNFESPEEGKAQIEAQVKQAIEKKEAVTFKGEKVVDIKEDSIVLQNGEKVKFDEAIKEGIDLESRNPKNQAEIIAEGQAINDSRGKVNPIPADLQKMAKESATEPMSKFVDNEIDAKQEQTMQTLVKKDHTDSYEVAKREVDEVVNEAIENAKITGEDLVPVMDELNAYVKSVDDYTDFMRKVATCAISKGTK